jgi:hypothetical protein
MISRRRLHATFWGVRQEKKTIRAAAYVFLYAKDHLPEAATLGQQGRREHPQRSRAACGRNLSLAATLRPGSSPQGAKPAFREREQ